MLQNGEIVKNILIFCCKYQKKWLNLHIRNKKINIKPQVPEGHQNYEGNSKTNQLHQFTEQEIRKMQECRRVHKKAHSVGR